MVNTTIIIILLSLSVILFVISFFLRDSTKDVRKELDEVSMQVLQESYLLKKRVKVLEEEIMAGEINNVTPSQNKPSKEINEVLRNQVIALHKQGLTVDQIEKQSALAPSQIVQIIKTVEKRG